MMELFQKRINEWGHVNFYIKSTTFEIEFSTRDTQSVEQILNDMKPRSEVNFTFKDDEVKAIPYYRRWVNPWTYKIFCRDSRIIPKWKV